MLKIKILRDDKNFYFKWWNISSIILDPVNTQGEKGTALMAQGWRTHLSMQETQVWSLSREDPLEKEVATHSSILAWEILWTEEPGCLWTVTYQAPLSMEFSRQEYWSGLAFSYPGDLPNPGIKTRSPTLQADSLLFEPPRCLNFHVWISHILVHTLKCSSGICIESWSPA